MVNITDHNGLLSQGREKPNMEKIQEKLAMNELIKTKTIKRNTVSTLKIKMLGSNGVPLKPRHLEGKFL